MIDIFIVMEQENKTNILQLIYNGERAGFAARFSLFKNFYIFANRISAHITNLLLWRSLFPFYEQNKLDTSQRKSSKMMCPTFIIDLLLRCLLRK